MHEYAIVESIVGSMLDAIQKQNPAKVVSVRFRRGSAFSEEAFHQAYGALTIGTPLAGADVEIETVNRDFDCACGHKQVITSDDLIGHMFACPKCGATIEVDEAHDLELVELLAEDDS
ncbi:MAG TPA: hydrogenase maturation nickel metallochaperone HypA [Chthoniobacterales bacterium]